MHAVSGYVANSFGFIVVLIGFLLQEVSKQYRGKGERSSEEAANLVGLSVPKTED